MSSRGPHPEQMKSEIFVGNTKANVGIPGHLSTLKTVRLGKQAYDIDGKPIPNDYMLPLFVGIREADLYNSIMMERTFGHR